MFPKFRLLGKKSRRTSDSAPVSPVLPEKRQEIDWLLMRRLPSAVNDKMLLLRAQTHPADQNAILGDALGSHTFAKPGMKRAASAEQNGAHRSPDGGTFGEPRIVEGGPVWHSRMVR